MPPYKGICGFETGRVDAGYTLVGTPSVSTVGGRTGLYCLRDQKTVAGIAGCANITTGVTIADGALFRIAFRFFFKVNTKPSVSGYVLGEFSLLSARLEMDNTGLLRLNSALEAPSAYSGQTIDGHWYEAQCLLGGYNKVATVPVSGRTRFTINVYDWGIDGDGDGGDPILLASFANTDQVAVNVPNINCDPVALRYAVPGDALQEMASKIQRFLVIVNAGAAPAPCPVASPNGAYDTFPSEVVALGDDALACNPACGPATNGAAIETGLLNGIEILHFKKNNSALGAVEFNVGQTGISGVSCTRDVVFDDVYFEIAQDIDVPYEFAGSFPLSTHVRPFPVTGQGFYDLFTPANHPADVAAIPMVDTNTITATLANFATSYIHDILDDFDMVEHLRIYARLQGTAQSQSLIAFEDPSILTFMDITIPAANGGVLGDVPLENEDAILGADFNLIEYGIILDNAGTVNLHSIFMEVLTGEADIVLEGGGTDGGAMIEGGLNLGDLGITNGALVLIVDGSGLYSITPGQFFDELYARNSTTEPTVLVQIPDPFWKTFYAGG